MKLRTKEEADVNITSLIDCLMQCIIFFMVIMSAQYVFGVAIKFPPPGSGGVKKQKQEKNIIVEVQADYLDLAPNGDQYVRQDGILKINGEEIALVTTVNDRSKWQEERNRGFGYLGVKIQELLDKGYKKDIITIVGDMKTYHWKTMAVIDQGKAHGIDGFSLVPPTK